MKFSSGVTVYVVFHSDGYSTKAVDVLLVVGGFAKASSVRTTWRLAHVLLVAVLSCIVNWAKYETMCDANDFGLWYCVS